MTATQIPPVNSSPGPGGVAPARPTPVSPASALAHAAPVRAAPEKISEPRAPVRLQGRTQPRAEGDKTLRIQTPQGEISVETDADIPPDTDVQVEIYQKNGQTLADVRLARAQASSAGPAPTAAPPPQQPAPQQSSPPPPLEAGDTVIALVLPEDAAAPQAMEQATTPAAPSTLPPDLARVADLLQQLKAAGFQSLAGQLPVSPAVREALLSSDNIPQTLQSLPLLDQEKLKDFFSQPAVQNALKSILPETAAAPASAQPPAQGPLRQALAAYGRPALPSSALPSALSSAALPPALSSAALPPAAGELADSNLLNIVKAQISAALTHDAMRGQPNPLTSPPAAGAAPNAPAGSGPVTGGGAGSLGQLRALLPFIENVDSLASPAGAILRQFAPSSALAGMAEHDIFAQKFQSLDIRAVFPPGSPAPATPPGLARGTVQMVTPAGYPIIAAEDGSHMILKSPAAVAEGSTVFFEATPLTLGQLLAKSQQAGIDGLDDGFAPLFSKDWPALQDALQEINRAGLQGQAQALANTLPAPTARLVPTTLFFLAALRMGSVENWLGPNVMATLRDLGKRDLAQRLTGDFDKLAAQSKETLSGEWRGISMPLLHDQQLSQIQMFVRRQHDGAQQEGGENRGAATRFVLNLSLSRMGDMQLDGLLKKKNFDLILRSADPFPEEIRDALRQAFGRGLAQTGMEGGLTFQRRAQHWVNIDLPQPPEVVV